MDAHSANHSGTGLLAIHEPDGEAEEEKASSVSPPLSPPGIPACIASPPLSVLDPLSLHPIASSIGSLPVPASTSSNNPHPTLEEALQVVAEHIHAVGDGVLEPLHPVIAFLCAQIREEEQRSMLSLLILLNAQFDNSDTEDPASQAQDPSIPASDEEPPPYPNSSSSVNFASMVPMPIPALQVSPPSPTLLSPPQLLAHNAESSPFIPNPPSPPPISSETASTPSNPSPTPDEVLQSIIEEIEFSGGTAAAVEEHPVIARICARIHEQEHLPIVDRPMLSACQIVDLSGPCLETCYALPSQDGVDTLGNCYQDYLILHTSLAVSKDETTDTHSGCVTQIGTAFTRFYPLSTPAAMTPDPTDEISDDPDSPLSPFTPIPFWKSNANVNCSFTSDSAIPTPPSTPMSSLDDEEQTTPPSLPPSSESPDPPVSGLQLLASAVTHATQDPYPAPFKTITYISGEPLSPEATSFQTLPSGINPEQDLSFLEDLFL